MTEEMSEQDIKEINDLFDSIPEWVLDTQVINMLRREGIQIDVILKDGEQPLIYLHRGVPRGSR